VARERICARVAGRARCGIARVILGRPENRPAALFYGELEFYGELIEIDPMITHTMPLADINKAFDLMHAGESIRSVVVF
jgi:hypothetical protein